MARTAATVLIGAFISISICYAGPASVSGPTMSTSGKMARARIAAVRTIRGTLTTGGGGDEDDELSTNCADGNRACMPTGPVLGLGGTQSETSIAVDSTGRHVVVGFNDFRGFSRDPLSISGFMYSDDGGITFHDGGQLPNPGNQVFLGQVFPWVFGDPDVKYLGGCNFIYSSLLITVSAAGPVQTIGVHRSTDCGHTWTGPIEVTPASNPNGLLDANGLPSDAADKELMDVDPETGRVIFAWSNFTSVALGGVEISSTYTDNIMSPTPTFAPRRVIAAGVTDGQGASVRFAGNGSPNAYVSWNRFTGYYTRRIGFARSTDNGQTWSAPVDVTPTFIGMDQVLGNDRVNEYPSIAVDKSAGPYSGNIYLVYSNNNNLDGADVSFRRSTDGGVSFSAAVTLNSRPGNDRPQWFPFVTVDKTTGRVHVFYYDQGVATSGDETQVTYLYSDDGGVTWSRPSALSDRPFKAGWGNTTGEPNLGDYNQSVAQLGMLYASYAITKPQKFTDGQPGTELITPDVSVSRVPQTTLTLPLLLGTVTFTESGGTGNLDPGDTVHFKVTLVNTDTNPLHASAVTAITAVLTSTTPGVTVTQGSSGYPNLNPGASGQNTTDFIVTLSPAFVPGTPIVLQLTASANGASSKLFYTQPTGTVLKTTLLSENFDGVAPGSLPPGWRSAHGTGENYVPWVTSKTFCGSSNKAFHQDAIDANDPTRWERLFSPVLTIPPDAKDVEVEYDVCYDTENDPNLRYLAYDGFFLRVTDLTPGRTLRSVLAEAFEEEFTTDGFKHYPRHLPRNPHPDYFTDMSVWAGFSNGYQHVHMRFPGMAGSTVQFRFEYTQDSNSTCADVRPGHTCGVSVDNFVVRSTRAIAPATVNLTWTQTLSRDTSGNIVSTITVTNAGTATAQNVRLTSAVLGTTNTTTSPLPTIGNIAPGASAVAVVKFPPGAGTAGSSSVLRIAGTYTGGTFGGSLRVTIP